MPTRTLPNSARSLAPLGLSLESLSLSLSFYLGALSSLPKLATCQKSGAATAWRQARNALKGQIALLALLSDVRPSEDNGGDGEIFWVSLWALNNKASIPFAFSERPRLMRSKTDHSIKGEGGGDCARRLLSLLRVTG